VVRALASAGLEVTALVRRPEQRGLAGADGAAHADTVELREPESIATALAGHDALYHVPPNMHPEETEIAAAVVEAAERRGVHRLVLHSVLAPYVPAMPHHLRKARSEELLRRSPLEWTILQPASYLQNTLAQLPRVAATGRLTVPYAGTAPFTPVDVRDVADVAALVLTEPERHTFASYELCGPQRLTSEDMATALSRRLGVDVQAVTESVEEWQASAGLPAQIGDDLAAMFGYYDKHGLVGSPWVLEQLLGRAATTFDEAVAREVSRRSTQA
jgi:NAD(P)H dehydrogenase (quinone)